MQRPLFTPPQCHYGDGRATERSIRDATRTSLEKADELGYESLVLPVLGTGAAGFDFRRGATLVCEELWGSDPESVTDVRVIAYSQDEYETLEAVADEIRSS